MMKMGVFLGVFVGNGEKKEWRVKFDDSFVGELFMRGIFLCDIILYVAVSLQILLFCLFSS